MVIRTPDQRLRVFVSSTIEELARERAAVRAAVERLRLAPVLFELGARPHPPRALYRAYLEQSHVFVGIYWQSYGWVAPDMDISGIEDEYQMSVGKPSLVYVKEPAPERQRLLDEFLDRVMGESRVSFKKFGTPEELGELVSDDLALLLTEHFQADEEGIAARGAPGGRLHPGRLPAPPTDLVDREQDVAAVCTMMTRDDVRLSTLSGVGGIGKTRLALAAAEQLGRHFPDGVAFADLTSVRSAELVPDAIATALGIRQEGTQPLEDLLVDRLEAAEMLLVLDGLEHVVEAGSFVSRLLAACPGVKVLVTSRALLHLRGEHELRVAPLTTGQEAAEGAAERLFVERAQEGRPGFRLDTSTAADVTELCARLDGIPLAIELAAARVRVLSPRGLLDRLSNHLDVLSGPADLPARQRTLRATIDWSYDLLDNPQREVFAALSVFPAGFTLDEAEAVVEPEVDAPELVSALIEQSLVEPREVPNAEPRFRMTQAVRQYAERRLMESGTSDQARWRMAEHFAQLSLQAGAGLITADHPTWLARLDPEVDNIRAVVQWARERGDIPLCLHVLVPLWVYWYTRGHVSEFRPLVEGILEADPALEPVDRAMLLQAVASSRALTGEHEACVEVLRQLLVVLGETADAHGLAMCQAQIVASSPIESASESHRLLDEAIPVLQGLGDDWGSAYALGVLGELLLCEGDLAEADRVQEESMEHARSVGSDHIIGLSLNERGLTALALGDPNLARARFTESARLHQGVQNREGLAFCLEGLARLAAAEGRPELAAKAVGAAAAIRDTIRTTVSPLHRFLREPLLVQLTETLGQASYAAATSVGRDAPPDGLVEELLSVTSR